MKLKVKNPFRETRLVIRVARGRLEERLLHTHGGGVKVEVADFHGKSHTEDYLDWKSNSENYFEWKPMAENQKVLHFNGRRALKSDAPNKASQNACQYALAAKKQVSCYGAMKPFYGTNRQRNSRIGCGYLTTSKGDSNSQVCVLLVARRDTSFACSQWRVNLVEVKELESKYDDYD
ncbi:conserved hypothetical protein [Ricinus communis]|uniref:Uncharacterized protein n=1 Tax=Ricinus communis TaxID=3988 RepID=B9ST55_RICCO|nr:conserved hypothetical protein [Ricinus communis]